LTFPSNGFARAHYATATADARAITAVLATRSGHLLLGTKKRGVLVCDGKQITVLRPTVDALYVTALAGSESDLWIVRLKSRCPAFTDL
jgi:hypothetical protein